MTAQNSISQLTLASVDDLEHFITATGDVTPIYWLISKFLEGDKSKHDHALEELARQLPNVLALIAATTTDEAVGNSASETVWASPHCVVQVNPKFDLFGVAA